MKSQAAGVPSGERRPFAFGHARALRQDPFTLRERLSVSKPSLDEALCAGRCFETPLRQAQRLLSTNGVT
ncbi:hypothetical protein FHY03_002702 [Sphingomonas sp. BK345]|nr:hypothetical protein [Sphingomonas sp. BK345]